MKRRKKIGFLGGSFDPIHWGHITLGLELQEKHSLDEILICPTSSSPFKTAENRPQALAEDRLKMVQYTTEDIPSWRVIDYEIHKEGPSYTIDTIQMLHNHYEENKEKIELYLLLGQDVVQNIASWKEVENLLTLVKPLIGMRHHTELVCNRLPATLEKICRSGLTPTRTIEMSSTLIRERLKRKLYCGHLVPAKVLDFIYHHQLYLI